MNNTDYQETCNKALARIIGRNMRSPGSKALISEIVKESINNWTGQSRIRKRIAAPALWLATRIGKSGPSEQDAGVAADVGTLLTALARKINAEHAKDPLCHSSAREKTFHNFLSNTDFGEIREMVEGSGSCVLKTVETFNAQLWKYPAKVGSILGTLLAATNTAIRSAREMLRPIEKNVGPDLLADMILSLLKGLDAKDAAELTNSLCEFIRRLHTGNYLLAKAGKPLFQIYLTSLLQEALPEIDPVLLKKAKIALAEDREAIANALADAMTENPNLVMEMISAYGSTRTPLIKGAARKVRLFEEFDQDQLADAASKGLSDLDTFEIAEVINGLLRTINSIHALRPEVFSTIATSIADSVDIRELRDTAQWLIPEFVEANRAAIEACIPTIINSLCDVLCPQGGIMDEEHREAFANLKTTLLAAGGEG